MPLATGDFAAALIEGFGAGRLVVTDDRVRDSFLVDPAGLRAWGVRLPDREAILARARDVGAAWRRAQQRR